MRPLNKTQIQILRTIYSCRFSTRKLLCDALGVANNTTFHEKLMVLRKYGYVELRYAKSYRLAGRPAEYHLTPKGLRFLRDTNSLEVNKSVTSSIYQESKVTDAYVLRTLTLLRIRNQLVATQENLLFFTARDTQPYAYFPSPRPAGFISQKVGNSVSHFFIEYVTDADIEIKSRKLIHRYARYQLEGSWEDTGKPFPTLLFIAESRLSEQRIRHQMKRFLYRMDNNIKCYTTCQADVLRMTSVQTAIWMGIHEEDDPVSVFGVKAQRE